MSISRRITAMRIEWMLVVVCAVAVVIMYIDTKPAPPSPAVSQLRLVTMELRQLRRALEIYHVRNGTYPRSTWGDAPFDDLYLGEGGQLIPSFNHLGSWLTTPVAYYVGPQIIDSFSKGEDMSKSGEPFVYINLETVTYLSELGEDTMSKEYGGYPKENLRIIEEQFGGFLLLSRGPDGTLGEEDGTVFVLYDPTNGLMSAGNIIVGEKRKVPF